MPDKSSAKTKLPARQRSSVSKGRDLRDDVQEFKREMILRIATDIFFQKGFQSTTVNEIASAMSVSKAVVYWNFSSKVEVLEEIADRTVTKLSQSVMCIDHDRSSAKNLAEISFRHSAIILTNQKGVAVYLFERRYLSAALKRKIRSQRDALVSTLAKLLETGVRGGEFRVRDPELVAYEIISMTTMSFDWRWHHDIQRYSPGNLSLHFAEQALRLAGYAGEFPFKDGELTIDKVDTSTLGAA
jgi:AcrR family transcriptional regulator